MDESIAAYKNALKLNPSDMEAKYNLSYALKLRNQQQNNQQNQQQQQDNKNNGDKNKDQQQNKEQQDDQKKEQDKKEEKDNNEQQKQEQKKEQEEISKDEAQRILEALKNNEAELQKKLRQKKGQKVTREKDW